MYKLYVTIDNIILLIRRLPEPDHELYFMTVLV